MAPPQNKQLKKTPSMTETTQDQNKKKQHRQIKKVENPELLSAAMKVVGNAKIAELSNRKVHLVKKGEQSFI